MRRVTKEHKLALHREANRRWRAAHPEKSKQCTKTWRLKNPEKSLERQRKWALKNPEKSRAKSNRWKRKQRAKLLDNPNLLQKFRDERNKYGALWKLKSPEKYKASIAHRSAARRLLKRKCVSTATHAQILKFMAKAVKCHYCLRPFSTKLKPTLDHIVPLAKGGSHSLDNFIAACRSCNCKKSAIHPHTFAKSLGRLLI